jgi:4-hydroxy-tetrahydrodipicolinate reductase
MNNPVRVVLVGSGGRMGGAIIEVAKGDPAVEIVARCDMEDPIDPAMADADVAIDFSHADAIEDVCAAASRHGRPLVIGTTGHSSEQRAAIDRCAATIAVVLSSNYSVGVNALFWLTRKAGELLGPDFDIEIVETHHRLKKDAPSGTALTLSEILQAQRELAPVHGRRGQVGERKSNEIGIHSVRGGDVVGDHTVVFAGAGERLELTHRATNRQTFAAGALRAARWIVGRAPGLYSMQDVLGLSDRK